MVNDCFDGNWWFKEQDEEGTFFDHDGVVISTWMDWTDRMGQAIDDQMCGVKESLTSQIDAVAEDLGNLPMPQALTKAAVQAVLGAPTAALTPPSGGSVVTVQVLGLTVIAGATGTIIQNLVTRQNELEARLKTLGLLT
jgi:hypothetical protein